MSEEILMPLGRRVRALRTARALTIRELAEQAELSQRFVASVEAGKANISVVRLEHLGRALGTTAAGLLSEHLAVTPTLSMSRWVSLLGLRGAGKTAVGKRVALRLGVPFIELDQIVVERSGMELGSLFALHGNDYYRRLERTALEDVLSRAEAGIVATGGGLVTNHATYGLLKQRTTSVFLRARAEDHWNRVVEQGDARPMADRENAMDELRAILRARRALYEQADHVVDTSTLGLERSVDAVVRLAVELRND
jgi:XRE family aerobic/anaerobic benzoate catabolism transcriptional regulator